MKKTFIFLAAIITLWACEDKDKDKDIVPEFDQGLLLSNLSDNIIVPNFQNLAIKTQELVNATDSFVLHNNQSQLDQLRTSYKDAYLAWQTVSFLEFGPSSMVGLKSNVNIYPTDVQLIEQNINDGNSNLDALNNKAAKGFPAVDYLLNKNPDSTILNQFSSADRKQYLQKVIADLNAKISEVNSDWSFYQSTFKNATGTDIGSSLGMLINALNQHLERYFRDGKIGIPLGVRSSGIAIPDNAEAYYGEFSFELIQENFKALQAIYSGNNSVGLDDYLISANSSDLNDLINSQMNIIESKINQFSGSMPNAIQNNSSELNATYSEIQKLIVYWKVDMPSRLGVLITYQDNDGD